MEVVSQKTDSGDTFGACVTGGDKYLLKNGEYPIKTVNIRSI
ncbi:hypothetical protein [Hydrogenophaga sp.]|jgi:hypothetical protein